MRVNHRDVLLAARAGLHPARYPGERVRPLVSLQVQQRRLGAGRLADRVVDLVPVAQLVHQALVQGLLREERPPVQQRAGVRRALASGSRDPVGDLLGDGLHQPGGGLAGRLREPGLGELVGC